MTILRDMGQDAAADAPLLEEAVDLASRLAAAAEAGRVDLSDLGAGRADSLRRQPTASSPAVGLDFCAALAAPVVEPPRSVQDASG